MAKNTIELSDDTVMVIQFDKNGEVVCGHQRADEEGCGTSSGELRQMINGVQLSHDEKQMGTKQMTLAGIKSFEVIIGKTETNRLTYCFHTWGCMMICL